MPLELTRPPVGTELLIPSPLLSFATCRPPDGSPPAGFWDDERYEWQERSGASATWLQFPGPACPVAAQIAEGPSDRQGLRPDGTARHHGREGRGRRHAGRPSRTRSGTLEFEINDPDILAVNDNGELTLGVSADVTANVSGGQSRGTANYWRIESLALQLWAVTTEPDGSGLTNEIRSINRRVARDSPCSASTI